MVLCVNAAYVAGGIVLLLTITAIILVGYYSRKRNHSVRYPYNGSDELPTVFSGYYDSDIELTQPANRIHCYNFSFRNNQVENLFDYKLFINYGNHLRSYGIENGAIIISNKSFNESDINNYPLVVIKQRNTGYLYSPAVYVLRRAWRLTSCNILEIHKELDHLLKSKEFQEIKDKIDCPRDYILRLSFFTKLINHYTFRWRDRSCTHKKVAICTAHSKKGIRLVLYPASDIIGEVVAAFPINDN